VVRFRERQRQVREQEIVQVARRLLIARGYHGTSMDEVAELVGISKATLYQHFPSKDDLIVRLIVEYLDRLLALVEQPARAADPLERLTAALRFLVAVHAQGLGPDVETQAGELRALLLGRPACRARYERVIERLTALVRGGQASGVIRPDLPPPVVVQALFGLSCAVGVVCGTRGGPLDARGVADSVVSLFLDGVRVTLPPSARAAHSAAETRGHEDARVPRRVDEALAEPSPADGGDAARQPATDAGDRLATHAAG
jgi:AcrR family transcriptional regulator